MNKDINLLGNVKKPNEVLRTRIRYLRYLAVSLLFLVSTASVVLFILIAFSPLPALQKTEQEALTELSQYHPKIAKYLFLNERLTKLQEMMKERRTFSGALLLAEQELPQGASITGAGMEDKTVRITIASKSLLPMDTFINSLIIRTEEKKLISTLRINELGVDEVTGNFELTVEMLLL
jgi:hypothetical protein